MASAARGPQSERRLSPNVMAALVAAIHAEPLQRRAAIRTTCETHLLCTALAFRAHSRAVNPPDHVDGRVKPTAVRFKLGSGGVGVVASRATGAAGDLGVERRLFGA